MDPLLNFTINMESFISSFADYYVKLIEALIYIGPLLVITSYLKILKKIRIVFNKIPYVSLGISGMVMPFSVIVALLPLFTLSFAIYREKVLSLNIIEILLVFGAIQYYLSWFIQISLLESIKEKKKEKKSESIEERIINDTNSEDSIESFLEILESGRYFTFFGKLYIIIAIIPFFLNHMGLINFSDKLLLVSVSLIGFGAHWQLIGMRLSIEKMRSNLD